jgi:adenylate kinase
VKRPEYSSAFSALGSPKAKILLLGPEGAHFASLKAEARSFSIEHVSPATLVQQEISRRTPHGQQAAVALSRGTAAPDQLLLAVFRKWFWARKPDAGFLLEGFPATLLQARVFDEWLDARGENLTAVFAPPAASAAEVVIAHYRTQGLLFNGATGAAAA